MPRSRSSSSLGAQVVVCNCDLLGPADRFGSFANVTNGASQSTVVFGDSGPRSGQQGLRR